MRQSRTTSPPSSLRLLARSFLGLILLGLSLVSTYAQPNAEKRPVAKDDGELASGKEGVAEPERIGKFIRLSPPLTLANQRVQRIVNDTITEAARQGKRAVFVFEIEPGQVDYGGALNLARFLSSPALNGATTIAYLPEVVNGHAVLVALACDEIVMAPTAELGDAGRLEPTIDEGLRNNYQEIASRRRTIPPAVAIGMLDQAVEVVQVETDLAREFVLASELPALKKAKPIRSEKVIKKANSPGMFTAKQLRELGFVS